MDLSILWLLTSTMLSLILVGIIIAAFRSHEWIGVSSHVLSGSHFTLKPVEDNTEAQQAPSLPLFVESWTAALARVCMIFISLAAAVGEA